MMVFPRMKSVREKVTPNIAYRKPRSSTNPYREIPARECCKYVTATTNNNNHSHNFIKFMTLIEMYMPPYKSSIIPGKYN